MADILPLPFRETYMASGARVGSVDAIQADPRAWVWDSGDPDRRADREWLDANAPGWTCRVEAKGVRTVELPIGRDPVGTFVWFDVILEFRAAAHRDAWRARAADLLAKAEARRAHVAAREATAPEGVEVCGGCDGHMEPHHDTETCRVAQFAFTYTTSGKRCPDCGMRSFRMGDLDAVLDATEAARSRVGLPDDGSPLWSDGMRAEWTRRRMAPPEVEVVVAPDMGAADILAALDAEIAKSGRPTGGAPPRVVA